MQSSSIKFDTYLIFSMGTTLGSSRGADIARGKKQMGERVFGGHVATYRKCSIPLKFKKCDFFSEEISGYYTGKALPCLGVI